MYLHDLMFLFNVDETNINLNYYFNIIHQYVFT